MKPPRRLDDSVIGPNARPRAARHGLPPRHTDIRTEARPRRRRAALRCLECAHALAEHPDPRVRLSLLTEGSESDVVALLVTDLDPKVQSAARHRLRAQAGGLSW